MVLEKVETVLNQMKRSRQAQQSVSLTDNGQQAVPYYEDRVGLVLLCHPTIAYTLSIVDTTGAGLGLVMPAAGAAVSLTLAQHGSIVKGPFWLSDSGGALTVTYWEVLNSAP